MVVPAALQHRAVSYVAPMAVFMALTAIEGWLPLAWYPFAYACKVVAVVVSLMVCRAPLADIRPTRSVIAGSVALGLVVFAAWIAIEKLVDYPRFDQRVGFNPFEAMPDSPARYAFLTLRLFGLALVVPVMEELFWRSFLLRFLTSEDFTAVPFDGFSRSAFAGVALLFGLAHPEWLAAVLTACAYGLLLLRTRSLFASVVAHATTNGALGVYVLAARDWAFW